MSFFQRLRYYIIGFGIGIVISFVIFGQRGCDWTPGNRVLKQIATSQVLISDSMRCVLLENKIEKDAIFKLLEHGSVIFSESNPQGNPKRYVLTDADEKIKIEFLVRNDSVSIIYGVPKGKASTCNALAENHERIFDMPEKTIKRLLKASEISASDSIINALKTQNIKDGDIYNKIASGKIDFERSLPNEKPHPIYFVTHKQFEFKIEMADKKARILEFKAK